MSLVKYFGSFLLDSGAFTFMSGSHKGGINWDEYVEEYAAFINRWDVKLFFELDIDSVVGLPETERLREKLEALTGKKPIPVWHRNRGKEYFIKMCEDYPYVALGGIVTKEIDRKKYETAFPWFIKTAHEHKCKIHGLGYTTVANLKKYHFDSVDSTSWLYGNRGGVSLQVQSSHRAIGATGQRGMPSQITRGRSKQLQRVGQVRQVCRAASVNCVKCGFVK